MNWRFWEPPHTVESVGRRLVEGLRDGSIVLDEPLTDEPFEDDFADDGFVVQIDVPEGTSDAEILDYIKRCALNVDQDHRSHGGNGLRIGKVVIRSPKVNIAFVPRNGSELTNGV